MSAPLLCCDELRAAYDVTFFNPVHGQAEWLAYGADFETVSAGVPEIRFWPVRYCPFCGAPLPVPDAFPRRGQPPAPGTAPDAGPG